MTIQEEIKEGIAIILESAGASREWTLNILEYLHSKGVVVKVEGKLPPRMPRVMDDPWSGGFSYGEEIRENAMKAAGYEAVEKLIGNK
ncbi:hypothetical protein LCGC14_1884560 [marine sediment metagenome]|uniref:Uncharacterized protein n=1 Tax=marine sediment metagenome TaxID=412755 RepID=A0A0F9G1C3_9ZZZZ